MSLRARLVVVAGFVLVPLSSAHAQVRTNSDGTITHIYIDRGPGDCDMDDEEEPPAPPPDLPRLPTPPAGGGVKFSGPPTPPPTPPSAPRMRGPASVGRRAPSEGLERWERWWDQNEARFLERELAQRDRLATGGLLGRGRSGGAERITPALVRTAVAPALLEALADPAPEVAGAAALSLARDLATADAPIMTGALLRRLGSEDGELQRLATLALGLLGDRELVAQLEALVRGDAAGVALLRGPTRVDARQRAFAAAALGLLGDGRATATLRGVVEDAANAGQSSLLQAAVVALGMVDGTETERAAWLAALVRDGQRPKAARAQAPIALARLATTPAGKAAARATLPLLVAVLQDEKAELAVRRGIAIALPALASADDAEAVAALLAVARGGGDVALKNVALIALGDLGGSDGEAARHGPLHAELGRFLTAEVDDGHEMIRRPFAAFALALWAQNPGLARTTQEQAGARLLAGFETSSNPSVRGAFALALGLLRPPEASAAVARAFDEAKDPELAGHLAVAIGLLGDRSAAPALRARAAADGHDARLARRLACSLALLRDAEATPLFLAQLRAADTLVELQSAAIGLGMLDDASAIAPLAALATDATTPQRRSAAVFALGLLAQRAPARFPAAFKVGANYLGFAPVLAELSNFF